MNPWALLIAFSIGATGAWKVQDWRAGYLANQRAEHEREVRMQRERAGDLAAEGHENDKRRTEERFVVITERVEHEIATSDFYAAGGPACLDDSGLRELRAAVVSPASSQPAPAMPAASRAR
jgi:hypothetical protein